MRSHARSRSGWLPALARLLALAMLAAAQVAAQEEAGGGGAPAPTSFVLASFEVSHDHAIGSGEGELRLMADGFEFVGEGEEAEHSAVWRDDEIKRLELRKGEIEIFAYGSARIPVLPEQLPWVDETKAVRVGTERQYEFHLKEGEVSAEVVREILARFKRPVGTTVVPNDPEESGEVLFEIPVFHRHVSGGESGVLRVYQHHVVFDAEKRNHSRHWRYSDIRDIGSLGRYKFEIATYEEKAFTDGKSYIFDLKRPMTEAEYEILWGKLYGGGSRLRVP